MLESKQVMNSSGLQVGEWALRGGRIALHGAHDRLRESVLVADARPREARHHTELLQLGEHSVQWRRALAGVDAFAVSRVHGSATASPDAAVGRTSTATPRRCPSLQGEEPAYPATSSCGRARST